MFKHCTRCVQGAIAALAVILASTHHILAQDAFASVREDPDGNAALMVRLHETIVDAAFDGEDLEDIFEHLRRTYELNIHVSWKNLATTGVRKDDRIEITLSQIPLSLLLDMILQEASSEDSDSLGYEVRKGIVMVSTREMLDRETILRSYDISDLIESGYSIRRFANTPVLGMQLTGREFIGGEEQGAPGMGGRGGRGGGGGGGGGGGVFGDPEENPNRISRMELTDQIVSLIQEHIDPESWRDLGGETGSIQMYGRSLFIQHTIDGHRRIESFLDLLRTSKPVPLDADVYVVHLRADKAARLRNEIGDAFPRLTAAQMQALLNDEEVGDVLFSATTSGHNGQRLWFSALTQREVLAGRRARLSANVAAYDSVTGVVTEGLELIMLPLLEPGGEALRLDVQMAWITPSEIHERVVDNSDEPSPATIDQVTRSMRTVSANASLVLGQGVVLFIPQQIGSRGQSAEYEDWLIVRVRRVE